MCFFHTNGLSWLMLQTLLNSLKEAATWLQWALCLSLTFPRPGTSSTTLVHSLALPGHPQAQNKDQPSTDFLVAYAAWPQTEHSFWLTSNVSTTIKAQLQQEGIHSSHGRCTLSTQWGNKGSRATGLYRTPATLGTRSNLGVIAALPNT